MILSKQDKNMVTDLALIFPISNKAWLPAIRITEQPIDHFENCGIFVIPLHLC